MKEKLKDKNTGSIKKLINSVNGLWTTDISRDYPRNPSDSMPRRIQNVLAVKRDATSC
jgi:hypothetical protein